MKKLGFYIIILLFLSCGEDDNLLSDSNLLSVKIDGEQIQFISPLATIEEIVNGFPAFGIIGTKGSKVFVINYLQLNEETPFPITIESVEDCENLERYLLFTYTDTASEAIFQTDCSIGETLKINFTSLEHTIGGRLTGSFSGSLQEEDGTEVLVLTDGKFDLKIEE